MRLETVTHSLGRDGLGCMITLACTGDVFILRRQAGVRTPEMLIQLTRSQIADMAAVVGSSPAPASP